MVNIIIVEDERIERDALSKLIAECFKDKITSLVSFGSGEQALLEVQQKNYQIIITDINIPCMNGLEMLHEVKKISPDIKIIILTGYDYFAYAQEAIRIGVDDFILKPSPQKDLCMHISKVIASIEKHKESETMFNTKRYQEIQSILQSDLIYAIVCNDSRFNIERYLTMLNIHVKCAFCICMKLKEGMQEQLNDVVKTLHHFFTQCHYKTYFEWIVIFVFHVDVIYDLKTYHLESMFYDNGINQCIGIGNIKTDTGKYYESYLEAKEHLDRISSLKYDHDVQDHIPAIEVMASNVMQAIRLNHLHIVEQLVERLCEVSISNESQCMHVVTIKLLQRLYDQMQESDDLAMYAPFLKTHLELLSHETPSDDAQIYAPYEVKSVLTHIIEERNKNMHKLIKASYHYISENYHKSIGLNDLAEYLTLTPQYVSYLFSHHEKNNFTNILAEYRIGVAKQLLMKKKVKEVASLVGFQNQNYFAKTFKKVTGFTPREYQEYYERL